MIMMDLIMTKALVRLSSYCKKIGAHIYAEKLDGMLGFEAGETKEEVENIIKKQDFLLQQRMDELDKKNGFCRFYYLVQECRQTLLAEVVMEFIITQFYYPEIKSIITEIFHPGTQFTLEDILRIIDSPFTIEENYFFLNEVYESVAVLLLPEHENEVFFRRTLAMDQRLLAYLCGDNQIQEPIKGICSHYFAGTEDIKIFVQEEYVAQIQEVLQNSAQIIQIAGENHSGRKHLLKAACERVQQHLLFVDFQRLCETAEVKTRGTGVEQIEYMLKHIKREMIFYGMGVCFFGVSEKVEESPELQKCLLLCMEEVASMPYPVCIITERNVHLVDKTDIYIENIVLPSLSRIERKIVWEGYCDVYGIEDLDSRMAAGKYRLACGEIAKAAARLAKKCKKSGSIGIEKYLARVCEEVLPSPVGGSIKQIEVHYTIDDLKIPDMQKQNLYAICAQVQHRQLVYDDWQMEKKFSYGRNVSALFVGAPGTGKTMAVHVLSSMLNLPLYKIDLSQVVDKYIGETEKKLEEIFNLAEKSNTILFFDEADSIFGKRSEVNDSKDRYANTEVSYILQRIEQYDGIVILASNYKKNIDEAFMRRMRYLVEFPIPDVETRKEIWRSSFTEQVPKEELDFDFLAENFELSGGIIKNIVLNAIFSAAQQGKEVEMIHILESLKNEKAKIGKPMIKKDFAKYEYLFD